ncbi:MAG: IS110 family transposase [Microthrixaceae bacterium]|nr:IS110 family transposase [Acidimicrobiales bacterium]MCB1015275.1 IS110 family transposase [Acidimicrobiales bacterium]MCB9386197.1 IS110 family transposase [Microthrixaceae bacterium]
MIYLGDDWAEAHHDVYVCDEHGTRLVQRRLPEGIEGVTVLHGLIAELVDDPAEVVVGIETDRGLWVQSLVEAGYQVYAINPKAASRYRDRHTLSGAKSDPGDAKMLAELVRTDRHNHRLVAGDSDLAESIKVLARAHQNLIWDRTRATNRLRSSLREYFPAALDTFDDLADRDALAVLVKAPTPAQAKALSVAKIRTALRAAGRQRNIDTRARQIADSLRVDTLHAPDVVVSAFAATTRSTVAIITAINTQIAVLDAELATHFEQHPDADIYLSQPGIGVILGARALSEFGDDPNRYADAKSRKNYAGTSPITRASGNRRVALARHVRNQRLADAIDRWAFCSLSTSPGARAYYDQRRQAGDSHHTALRALSNRLVGILHGCLRTHTPYNEHTAWAHRPENQLIHHTEHAA